MSPAESKKGRGGEREMSTRIQELLQMLHTMISEAWGLPLGAEKCVIERDKALDLLDEIKAQFPSELAEAKRLLDARSDFVNNAKREAEQIKRGAEERARQLIEEQEITRISRAKSNEMLNSAHTTSTELRRVANEYVDDTMKRTEEAIAAALEEIRQSRTKFRHAARAAAAAAALSDRQPDDTEDKDEATQRIKSQAVIDIEM
jgi:dsDNA-specific endonuclease/ATPase MutS2